MPIFGNRSRQWCLGAWFARHVVRIWCEGPHTRRHPIHSHPRPPDPNLPTTRSWKDETQFRVDHNSENGSQIIHRPRTLHPCPPPATTPPRPRPTPGNLHQRPETRPHGLPHPSPPQGSCARCRVPLRVARWSLHRLRVANPIFHCSPPTYKNVKQTRFSDKNKGFWTIPF